jgi:predicted nucleotidyltransferase
MSQNEINNEIDNNAQENIIKTSNIIKNINAVVIPNIEESSNKTITDETNFIKNEEFGENKNKTFYQSNDENINIENFNKINNENSINNFQNNYNNEIVKENNINQINHGIYEINNNQNLIQKNETELNSIPNQNNINDPTINYTNINNNNIDQIQPQINQPNPVPNPNLNFSPSSSSSKNPSKKRSSYDKKSNQKTMKDLAFKFPIKESLSKVEIPFSFQQNLDDPNNDSRFHSYITIKDTPRLYIDISDDQKIDEFKMPGKIDSLKNANKEKEDRLKTIDDNIMKFKEENNLLNKEIEKIKNEIIARNNEMNKLNQSIQQLSQGNNKYEADIKQKLQEKNNSYVKLKEIYDKIKSDIQTNKLDENTKKEYILKIKEESNKIQKEYQNNFKYYSNKLMNNNIYPDEYIKQCLQKDLIDFNNYVGARIQMISPKVKELINYIQKAVDASIGKDYEVKLYGSHATGLCLPWSDIDVVLCKKNGDDIDTNLYITLHELYLYLKEKNNFKDIKHIGTTTVPLIKIKTKENIGIQSVDISLQDKSHYGIKCVSLVLSFKEEYEVFLPMILALKNILKQANLNDPYKVRIIFI